MPETVLQSYEVGVKGTDWTQTVVAETAGKAKYGYLLDVQDAWPDVEFKHLTCRSLGPARPIIPAAQLEAMDWDIAHPIGTPVEYWTWTREGKGKLSVTRSSARVIGGHASVWVEGEAACISLSHVKAVENA